MAEKSLKERLDEFTDAVAYAFNWIESKIEYKSNKKGYLNSDNPDHYPNIPAVVAGIEQALIDAGNYTDDQIQGVMNLLSGKVDKVEGYGLSKNDFTDALKQKLQEIEGTKFKGGFNTLSQLKSNYPEGENESWHKGEAGWYASVGAQGEPNVRYNWDENDYQWVEGGSGEMTGEQIFQLLFGLNDVNNFDDGAKAKLDGIEEGAEKNVQSDMAETDSSKPSYVKNKKTKLSEFSNDKNFVSQQWVLDQEYLKEHQSLAGYALLSDIKNGSLKLVATGALSGGSKEFTANQDGYVSFTIDLTTATKNKIDTAYNGRIVSIDVVADELILTTQDNTEIKLDLGLIKKYMDIPTKVSELENDAKYIIGDGTRKITISDQEPVNPRHQDLWVTKELRKGTGTYIDDLGVKDPYLYEEDTYWDNSEFGGNWQNVTYGNYPFIQKRLYRGMNLPVSLKQRIELPAFAKKINKINVYPIAQNDGWLHLVGHRRLILTFLDEEYDELGVYDEYKSNSLPSGGGRVGVDTFEDIDFPVGTVYIDIKLTTESTKDSDYLGLGGLDGELVMDNTEFTPVWKIWDEQNNEWLPFGGEDEDYPDYAQQLRDGLNF